MITDGFFYFATLVFMAALLVGAQKVTKAKFFEYVPPVVLLYLAAMLGCTFKLWDPAATKGAYSALRNPILYAMIFVMLLRCDIRQILKLGPKMLLGFFTASITIAIGFVATYALMHNLLGEGAWRGLGALCGSWMGGSGNLVAVADALQATEAQLAGASIVDNIDYSIWVMFLLWAIGLAPAFNKWMKADTKILDEVSSRLDAEFAEAKKKTIDFPSLIFLLGLSLILSALCTEWGTALRKTSPKALQVFDVATFRIVLISVLGLILALILEPLALSAVRAAFWAILYGGVVSVGAGYTLQVVVQRRAKPTHAAILLSTEAPFAALGGWLLLNETLTSRMLAGCVLMFAAMLIIQLAPERE